MPESFGEQRRIAVIGQAILRQFIQEMPKKCAMAQICALIFGFCGVAVQNRARKVEEYRPSPSVYGVRPRPVGNVDERG
ncbi:hypothetical protein J1C52_04220 [Roseibaca sp. Y0-43]|nr:hypothetical protein [Roseibaca sp. Y0-43]